MAHEITIAPKTRWEKLMIFWRMKNFSAACYDIALILAVAIFTNRKIYEEELAEARSLLREKVDEEGVEDLMAYIEMKLENYVASVDVWHEDQQRVRTMIERDEELYAYFLDIFEADACFDAHESDFEASLIKGIRRS